MPLNHIKVSFSSALSNYFLMTVQKSIYKKEARVQTMKKYIKCIKFVKWTTTFV